jgi:hypothetical protein
MHKVLINEMNANVFNLAYLQCEIFDGIFNNIAPYKGLKAEIDAANKKGGNVGQAMSLDKFTKMPPHTEGSWQKYLIAKYAALSVQNCIWASCNSMHIEDRLICFRKALKYGKEAANRSINTFKARFNEIENTCSMPQFEAVKRKELKPYKRVDAIWAAQVDEIEKFFEGRVLPNHITICSFCYITHPELYLKNHISTCRAQEGNNTYRPYLNRLFELKTLIENEIQPSTKEIYQN